jgi:hypothetical protein
MHHFHVWYVITHPHKELSSREDCTPFFFWKYLPYGASWAVVRMLYEPLTLAALAVVGFATGLLGTVVSAYFMFGAGALIVRTAFLYYHAWEYLRDILDQFYLDQKMTGGSPTSNSQEAMARVLEEAMARRPKGLPQGVVASIQKQAQKSLPAELQKLIDGSKDDKTT